MAVLNWICFVIVCLDTVGYIIDKASKARNENCILLGLLIGIAARVYVLYNAAIYWLLA